MEVFGKKINGQSFGTITFVYFRITSYVAFAFHQAKPYIYVDDNIISTALDWLANNQQANGSFYEVGSIVHHEMQNRNGDSLALTAFVITAFIENQVKYNFFLLKIC